MRGNEVSGTPATSTGPRRVVDRRFEGVDVARGLAIIGMLFRHVGPTPEDPDVATAAWFYSRSDGRASVLFVLVAGVGVALLAARRPDRWLRARLAYRALWLLPLGLGLQTLDHGVAVILKFYAAYFLVILPFVRRSDRTVLVWAAATSVAGPALVLGARQLRPEWMSQLSGDPPNQVVDVLLTGYYPVVTYLSPMLVGLWLGRLLLRHRLPESGAPDPRVAWTMISAGTAALLSTTAVSVVLPTWLGTSPDPAGWSYGLSVDGHSEMPLALLGATGTAVAVLGACLLVAARFPRTLWPATAFGRLALTVYVGHLLALAWSPDDVLDGGTVVEGASSVAIIVAVSTVVALVWTSRRPHGPLEELERWPFERYVAPWLRSREAPPTPPAPPAPLLGHAASNGAGGGVQRRHLDIEVAVTPDDDGDARWREPQVPTSPSPDDVTGPR
jgi:uncharacterized membrane protein YeiB